MEYMACAPKAIHPSTPPKAIGASAFVLLSAVYKLDSVTMGQCCSAPAVGKGEEHAAPASVPNAQIGDAVAKIEVPRLSLDSHEEVSLSCCPVSGLPRSLVRSLGSASVSALAKK